LTAATSHLFPPRPRMMSETEFSGEG
jgi:hypothetical protein